MSYTVLSHTADTGVEATAESLASLIGELASGMFATMATVDLCSGREVEVEVEAGSLEDLVVDALSELLYLAEVEDLVLCEFEAGQTGPLAVRLRARGVPSATVEATGPAVKAVTYHDLAVTEEDNGWYGRVFFDV